jgi:cytochrome c5
VNQEDKQFMSQFMIVLGALVVFSVIIFFLARYLALANQVDYGPLVARQTKERIEPVGEVATGKPQPAAAAATGGTADVAADAQGGGQQVYATVCAACHDSGVAGAPMLTDKTAWQARIDQGKQTLYTHAINGLGAMPPKGGDASLSDAQVKAAVDYIVVQATGAAAGGKQQQAAARAEEKPPTAGARKATQQSPNQDVTRRVSPADLAQDKSGQKAASSKQPSRSDGGAKSQQQQSAASAKPAGAASTAAGEKIYQQVCAACHDSGAAGAPMLTDASAWKTRIAKGEQTLYKHAIHGFGAMPPKGGNPQLSDDQVKAAVDYMLSEVR